MKRQVFKDYQQSQSMLLPPNLEELIPERHLCNTLNEMIKNWIETFLKHNTKAEEPAHMILR